MKKRHEQKLIILSIALLMVFNVPFAFILDQDYTVMGFPAIYFHIFSIWFSSIIISFLILKRHYE